MYPLPHYIETAFEALYGEDPNEKADAEEAFASRWRGIDEARFWQALAKGEGADKTLAIFVIGRSGDPAAPAAIVPFLSSADRKERWASALCLGEMKDTRAYPYLETMLIEGLSLDPATWPHTREAHWEEQWYDDYRIKVLRLLESWNTPSLIPAMRQAYQRIWELEQAGHPHLAGYTYQDALIHELGQRGAFGVLTGLNLPSPHLKTAMLQLALGSLRQGTLANALQALIGDKLLQEEVAAVLEQQFGLSKDEREDCVLNAYEYSIAREATELEDEQDAEEEEEERVIFEEEDDLIESSVPTLLCQYQGHTAQVKSVKWSPDGTKLASGSADASVKVWKWTTGETLTTFSGHTASVNIVAWSPTGRFIASGGSDNMVYVWDALTGEQITAYAGHSAWIYAGLAWSPDGKYLASGSWDGTVQIWEASSGKTLLTYQGHTGIVCSVVWSPDGTRIASGGGYPECLIHIWDALTGSNLLTYRDHSRDFKEERPLWHIIDRDAEEWARGASSVHSLSWSPDGTYLASAGSRLVMRVWKATTGENIITSDRTCGPLVWSPDGQYLLLDHWGEELEVWQVTPSRRVASYCPPDLTDVEALSWSPDGKYIAVAGNRNILVCTSNRE